MGSNDVCDVVSDLTVVSFGIAGLLCTVKLGIRVLMPLIASVVTDVAQYWVVVDV